MAVDAKTEALIARLTAMLEPVVVDLELELVELQFRREPAGWVLRLIIDGPQGISLDDCSRVSREVGHLLEVEDPIEWPYRLEVSSPGLDRPLKRERDYLSCLGKKAKIVTREPVGGSNNIVGMLRGFADGTITVETEQGMIAIPMAVVTRARLVVEF
ncbi:MAG TPA: ribosome maturation factor RimP [Desulfurivibrionaceae bacterium]|nr:ribosome maturation factor RimP [Desulfurivibrionaceae bacterium]